MPSIILVDDHQLVSDGFKKLIEAQEKFDVIASFQDPKEALIKVPILKPNIVISDLDMPGLNGLELIQQLKAVDTDLKFIMITMHMDQTLIKKIRDLGVLGFLPKNTEEFELIQCIEAVSSGRSYYSQKAMEMAMSTAKPIEASPFSKKLSTTAANRS